MRPTCCAACASALQSNIGRVAGKLAGGCATGEGCGRPDSSATKDKDLAWTCWATSAMALAMMLRMCESMWHKLPKSLTIRSRICRLSSSLDASQSSTRSERMRSAMAKMTSTEVQEGSPMMPIGVAKVTRMFCWVAINNSKRHHTRCSGTTSASKTITIPRTMPPVSTRANALWTMEVPKAASMAHWLLEKEHIQYVCERQRAPATDSACRRMASAKSMKGVFHECDTKCTTVLPPQRSAKDVLEDSVRGKTMLLTT
mmetsp:Transcript_50743/g.131041  ORF Transcript_50743/g.131041 Transcript_50743/m.131041 type:complete len:258 (-) Transcript_50743:104-877(-)